MCAQQLTSNLACPNVEEVTMIRKKRYSCLQVLLQQLPSSRRQLQGFPGNYLGLLTVTLKDSVFEMSSVNVMA